MFMQHYFSFKKGYMTWPSILLSCVFCLLGSEGTGESDFSVLSGTSFLISADLLRSGSFLLMTTRGSKDPKQRLAFQGAQTAGVRAVAGDSA